MTESDRPASDEAEATPLVTYEQAEQVLLSSRNPRMRPQYEQGIINPIVLAQAIGCRPQMIYNYIKQGKIKTVVHGEENISIMENSTQKIVLEWAYAVEWVQKYLNRKTEAQARVEAELRGDKP